MAKAKRKSARDLKNMQERALLGLRIYEKHPKNYHIFPLKVAKTLLSASRKDTTGA